MVKYSTMQISKNTQATILAPILFATNPVADAA